MVYSQDKACKIHTLVKNLRQRDGCNMQVGKLAKKLPVGDVKAMAAQLGGAEGALPAAVVDTADINEEDLT